MLRKMRPPLKNPLPLAIPLVLAVRRRQNVPIFALPNDCSAELCTIVSAPRERYIGEDVFDARERGISASPMSVLSPISCRNKKWARRRQKTNTPPPAGGVPKRKGAVFAAPLCY